MLIDWLANQKFCVYSPYLAYNICLSDTYPRQAEFSAFYLCMHLDYMSAYVYLACSCTVNEVMFLTAFITGLLNNVGTHIDPTRLIKVSNECT